MSSRNILAQFFDYLVLYTSLSLGIFAWPFSTDGMIYFHLLPLVPFIWAPIEIILLCIWGTTPGSSLMGFTFCDPSKKISLSLKKSILHSLFIQRSPSFPSIKGKKRLLYTTVSIALISCTTTLLFLGNALVQLPQEFGKTIAQRGWVRYEASEEGFSADFPRKPHVETKQLEVSQANRTLDYQEYSAEHTDQVSYSVSTLYLPNKWRIFGNNTILKGALTVVLDNMPFGTKLLFKQLCKHGEYPAIDFHILYEDKETKGRLVLVDGKLYKVEVSYSLNTQAKETGIAFINSFKISPQAR